MAVMDLELTLHKERKFLQAATRMKLTTPIQQTTLTSSHSFTPVFDDLVVWVSPNILFNRMVVAGKLP